MGKIIGGTATSNMLIPDWNQTNPNRADYIKNKPAIVQTTGDSETDIMSQKATTEELDKIDENKVSYEVVKSTNLVNEETVVRGSWFNGTGNLASNEYTGNYHAVTVPISNESAVTISYKKINSEIGAEHPYLYNYFLVYEDGSIVKEGVDKYPSEYTITIPSGVIELRINLNLAYTLGTDWNLMINEGTEALPYEAWYEEKVVPGVAELEDRVSNLENKVSDVADLKTISNILIPRIVLSDKIFAVANDTIQIFYKSLFDSDIGNLHIMFECAKGKNYPRYWEYTPTANDVGSYPITIKLLNNTGDVIAEKTSSLVVVTATNPTSPFNVLCVGDSTMSNGNIPIEASRRMKGTTGEASSPTALSLSNINFVGRVNNAERTVGWEGTGGWEYGSYIISGYTSIRFTVSGANDLNIDAAYQIGDYKVEIKEINVTDGSGNIRCYFYYSTPYTSAWDSTPQSGTMTLFRGNGQSSVDFSAWTKELYQPFWNANTNEWDIIRYRDKYCNGQIDAICVLLGINRLIGQTPFTDVYIEDAKKLFRNIHSQLPNCKIIVSTLPPVSPNGGIAANYGASSAIGAYSAGVKTLMVADYNLALIEMAESEEFSPYVVISNSHAQFDSENGYPTTEKVVNSRSTTKETLQNNGVHPNYSGYWQLSDAMAFRGVLGVLNQ